MSRSLTPEEERLLQGFLEAFHYPEQAPRRAVLSLRDEALPRWVPGFSGCLPTSWTA